MARTAEFFLPHGMRRLSFIYGRPM